MQEADPIGEGSDTHKQHLDAQVHLKISAAEAKLQATLESDWKDCCRAIAEVTCPFCFYASV